MPRAVHLPIHHARGLMHRADGLAAARALRHLVDTHRLVGPPLAVAHARGAQPAATLGRVRSTLLGVTIADDPPAAATRLETRRAGRVVALRADTLVRRAMLHPAGRADARVLLAGRLLIYPAGGDAVIGAEVLGAHGAPHRARVTRTVLVLTHDQFCGGRAAMWTRNRPGSGSREWPLRRELRAAAMRRFQLPLRTLHQHASLDELEWMHDRLDLVAAHLLGPAPLVQRRDRTFRFRVGLVREDRGEVAVEPIELRGDLLFGGGLQDGDPLRILLPQVAEQQPKHLLRLAWRHLASVGHFVRGRWLQDPRLEILKQAGHVVARRRARRQIEHVALDDGFFDRGAGAQHDAGDQPSDGMRGEARLDPPCRAIAHGNGRRAGRCDALRILGARWRNQTEREPPRPRADRLDQMRQERTAEHGDLGVGAPLQGVERQSQPQRRATLKVGALGRRQLQLAQIRALIEQLDPGEIAVALDERPDARIRERIHLACCRRRWCGSLALGLGLELAAACHVASTWISTSTRGKRSTCATRVIVRPELPMPVSRTSSPYWG